MSTWIKANPFLVAAAALPLVIVIFFLAATTVPKWFVDDPQYDLLFSVDHYDQNGAAIALRYQVVDGALIAEALPRVANSSHYGNYQRLYRFEAATQTVLEVVPRIPQSIRDAMPTTLDPDDPSLVAQQFAVTEFSGQTLRNSATAPDGYVFDHSYRGRRGLFGELLGIGGHRHQFAIRKQGRLVELQVTRNGPYYHRGASLLGWVSP